MPRCQHYRDGTHGLRQLIGARSHRGHTLVLPSLLLSGHFYCSGLCSTTRCVGGFCSHAGRNYNHSSVWHAIQPVHANRCQRGLMPLLERAAKRYVEKLYFVPMLYGLEDVSVIVLKASLTERMRKTCKDGDFSTRVSLAICRSDMITRRMLPVSAASSFREMAPTGAINPSGAMVPVKTV